MIGIHLFFFTGVYSFLPDRILTDLTFAHIIKNTFTQYGRLYAVGKGGGTMKKALWQKLLLSFAVITFSCLLISGGSRLIATPDKPSLPIAPASSWMRASVSCPPQESHEQAFAQKTQTCRLLADAPVSHEEKINGVHLPYTDSNGNILRHASYMRAVYQAFALSDGFA